MAFTLVPRETVEKSKASAVSRPGAAIPNELLPHIQELPLNGTIHIKLAEHAQFRKASLAAHSAAKRLDRTVSVTLLRGKNGDEFAEITVTALAPKKAPLTDEEKAAHKAELDARRAARKAEKAAAKEAAPIVGDAGVDDDEEDSEDSEDSEGPIDLA